MQGLCWASSATVCVTLESFFITPISAVGRTARVGFGSCPAQFWGLGFVQVSQPVGPQSL